MIESEEKIKTLPVYDKDKLLLLKLTDTEESKRYKKKINNIYKEIYYENIVTKKDVFNEDDMKLLQCSYDDKILGNRIINEKLERVIKHKRKIVWNEDIGRTTEIDTEYIDYEKKYNQELMLQKNPYMINVMEELLSTISNGISYESIKLNKLNKYCDYYKKNIEKKYIPLNSKELNLTELEVLEIFKEYLSLLNIKYVKEYKKVDESKLDFSINHMRKAIDKKDNQELIKLLIDKGYITDYMNVSDSLLLPNYNKEQVRVAKDNAELLEGRLKVLKKSIIRN